MSKHYTVSSRQEAWDLANKIFPTDYMKDDRSSENAGYPIYNTTCTDEKFMYFHISDLNTRLELNMEFGNTVNIWIDDRHPLEKAGFKKNALGIWVAA